MKDQIQRRRFIKQSLAAGGSMFFMANLTSLKAEKNIKNILANETLQTIHNLRTIHGNFSKKNLTHDQIRDIVDATVQAANSSNIQTYSIIVVKDRQKMQNVCGYQGGCMLVFCADHNRIHRSAKYLGYSYHSDNIINFVTATMNTMLAAQTAVIAAKSMGIDSLLTNGLHRGDMDRVWKILNLPEKNCFPLIALILGYPTEEPVYNKGRLGGVGVVHHETYHSLTEEDLDEITAAYDDHSTHLALNPDWDKQGFSHYQDWLYRDWLDEASNPINQETQMFQLLKRSGYVDLQNES